MQGDTEDKYGVQHDASARPVTGRRLGILIVELRDEMGSAGSAGARGCMRDCAGRKQCAATYAVMEIALASRRATRREKVWL